MKRKFTAAVVAVLAAGMMLGTTAFASTTPSPSTKTTEVKNSSETSTTATTEAATEVATTASASATETDYIPRSAEYQNVAGIRFESDYKAVTDNTVLATAAKAQTSAAVTKALDAYIAATEDASKTVFGTYKVQMYKAGKSTWDGFGTFNLKITVGNKYDGKTAIVYVYHKDGTISRLQIPVNKGKLVIPMTEMGTIKILF